MRGRFKLTKRMTSYGTEVIHFGNLVDEWDLEGSALVSSASDTNHYEIAARTVAHDVVEHTVAHRTRKYVPIEEELRAIGAAQYVRAGQFDLFNDIADLTYLFNRRELKRPPIINDWFSITVDEVIECAANNHDDIDRDTAQTVIDNINYGYWVKKQQYKPYPNQAWHDFHFIQTNTADLIRKFCYEDMKNKVSVTFDTIKHTFRPLFTLSQV